MDRELAVAVFQNWADGEPVYETSLYKAASVLGIDPVSALLEARFYHHLDNYFIEKRAMTRAEKTYFAAAAGVELHPLEKTASKYRISPEKIIITSLVDRGFVPDIEKIAFLGMQGGPTEAPSMDMEGNAGPNLSPDQAPPEPWTGVAIKQTPSARPVGGGTSPNQMAPSAQGNFMDLLGQGQQDPNQMGAQQPQQGQPQQPDGPTPEVGGEGEGMPTPEQMIQQVMPDIHPENIQRYAQQFYQFQQQIGMPVSDPQQIQKFIQQLQKVDHKIIDQGIKEMGEQLEMEAGIGQGQQPYLGVKPMPARSGNSPAQVGKTSPAQPQSNLAVKVAAMKLRRALRG